MSDSTTTQSVTELDEGIDPETKRNIETTFETESELDDYIINERQRRQQKRNQRLKQELHDAEETHQQQLANANERAKTEFNNEYNDNLDSELQRNTVRVTQIDTTGEKFILTLKTRSGDTFTKTLDFAIPENTGSDWVKLCNWLDVNPKRPTELRGKVIPTTIASKPRSRAIDTPPINAGLNPYVYKSKRVISYLKTTPTAKKAIQTTTKTADIWAPPLRMLLSIVAFAALLITVNTPVSSTTGSVIVLISLLLSVEIFYSAACTLRYTGDVLLSKTSRYVLIPLAEHIYRAGKHTRNRLFPTS